MGGTDVGGVREGDAVIGSVITVPRTASHTPPTRPMATSAADQTGQRRGGAEAGPSPLSPLCISLFSFHHLFLSYLTLSPVFIHLSSFLCVLGRYSQRRM